MYNNIPVTPRLVIAACMAAAIVAGCTSAKAPLVTAESPSVTKTLTFSILEDYDKGDDLDEVARDFDLFTKLNVTTWRGSFGWDDYEPEPGKYDFAWLHSFMALAEQHGITLRPYIGYTPEWAAGGADKDGQAWNQPPRDQASWSAFVQALAAEVAHHPNVRSLEIYNEENVLMWWEGSAREYGETLRTAARSSPRLPLVMGGLVFPDVKWIEAICEDERSGGAFSVLAVHAYPETWTPESVTVENYLGESFRTEFLPTADRACGRKPIWINETGFATTPGKTEAEQAAWWVRAVATFAAEPRVEHIGIYEIKDLRPDRPVIGDAPNYHLGLTNVARKPKLAFATVKALVGLFGRGPIHRLENAVAVSRTRSAGELHHHYFERENGEGVFAVWNRTADEIVDVRLPRASQIEEVDLTGRTLTREGPQSVLRVELRRGVPRMFVVRGPGISETR
jgi:hypothetical protein